MEEVIREVRLKKNLMCEKHNLEKIHFCMDEGCKKALCSDCFIEEHIGHKKRRVAEVYLESKKKIDAALLPLQTMISELEAKEVIMKGEKEEVLEELSFEEEQIQRFTDILRSSVTSEGAKRVLKREQWT